MAKDNRNRLDNSDLDNLDSNNLDSNNLDSNNLDSNNLDSNNLDSNNTDEMTKLSKIVDGMNKKVDKMYTNMHYSHIADYVLLMNSPRKLFTRSIISGIGRGVGIAIGLTVFLVSLLYFLRALGALDLPIIGDYIADIVEIVQNQLQVRSY